MIIKKFKKKKSSTICKETTKPEKSIQKTTYNLQTTLDLTGMTMKQ